MSALLVVTALIAVGFFCLWLCAHVNYREAKGYAELWEGFCERADARATERLSRAVRAETRLEFYEGKRDAS